MKSLPEHEFWKVVSNRLEQYSEEPSSVEWDKIRGALPPRPSNTPSVNRATDVIVLAFVAFLLGFQFAKFSGNGVEALTLSGVQKKERQSQPPVLNEKILEEAEDTKTSKIADDYKKGNGATRNNSESDSNLTEKGNSLQTKALSFHSTGEIQRKSEAKTIHSDLKNAEDSQRGKPYANTVQPFTSVSDTPGGRLPIIEAETKSEFNNMNGETNYFSQDSARAPLTETRGAIASQHSKSSTHSDKVVKADSAASLRVSKDSDVKANALRDQKEKQRRKFRPTIFAQLNPSMTYQKIIPATDDNITIQKLNSPGIISAERFGLSGEIGLQIPVMRFLEVYASFGYYRQSTKISYDFLSDENPTVNASRDPLSFEVTPSSITKTFDYTSQHKGIAMGAFYFVRRSKLQQKFGAGIFYMHGNCKVVNDDVYNTALSQYAGYQLHYRLEYLGSARASLYVQPFFKHSLFSSGTQNEPFRIKPYWAGIGVGYIYRF